MNELDKLEKMLSERDIEYERIDQEEMYYEFTDYGTGERIKIPSQMDRHEIFVPNRENCEWDAICQKGSYGYAKGLLEIYGSIVNEEEDGDSVVGWLTAEEVMHRLECIQKALV